MKIFDPVEFDPVLRQLDLAADLAFLVMELQWSRPRGPRAGTRRRVPRYRRR